MHTDTQKINCLIVDDEPLAQGVLAAHMARIPALNLVQQCSNAMEAFEALHKNNISLIFLDINMPVVSGLNFLRSLKDPPAVILTTAYTEYAIEGYELDVVDYLLKPVPFERFFKAVQKALMQLNYEGRVATLLKEETNLHLPPQASSQVNPGNNKKSYFFIKADGKLVKVNYSDIKFIEGMKDYLKIHTTTNTIVTHYTMKAMEEQLPSDKFMRVHKSYILALSAIKSIEGNIIHLDMDKAEIPLGSSFRDALLTVVGNS